MKNNNQWLSAVIGGLAVIGLSIPFAGMEVSAANPDQQIKIVYTNDVHCGVDDKLGYAGLSLFTKEVESTTPYVTLVDAGDAIQGAPIGTISQGSYITDLMNEVGYDIAIPGNHEFDYGMDQFLSLADQLDCGYISCNFVDLRTKQLVFAPYKIESYGDTKVAFVGCTTPESFTSSTPKFFQDENGEFIYTFCEDDNGQWLYYSIQLAVDAARAEGADFVIMVGHLGENYVTDYWSGPAIIENTSGIDAVIDGHSHEVIPNMTVKNKNDEDVILTQTGTKLQYIGMLTINQDGSIEAALTGEVPEVEGYSVTNEKGQVFDIETDQAVKSVQNEYEGNLLEVVGHTDFDLLAVNSEGRQLVRAQETNLGDLCADAFRKTTNSDIAVINGGGIRANITAGDITYKDLMTVFPFGNDSCVIEATGQQILDALENGAGSVPELSGGFLQVSGLHYTVDTSVPSSVVKDEKGNFIRVDGEYRVKDVQVGEDALDLNKTYTVSGISYILLNGGNGMTMFDGCKIVRDKVAIDIDVLTDYVRSMEQGIDAEYRTDSGRITIR